MEDGLSVYRQKHKEKGEKVYIASYGQLRVGYNSKGFSCLFEVNSLRQ